MNTNGHSDTVLVVGAGLAGLICAHRLREHGISSIVVEKGRGPGGRQSTRRESLGEYEIQFDHGAQYFTVTDPEFDSFLARFRESSSPCVVPWTAPIVSLAGGEITGRSENTERFVCQPGMNALAKSLTVDGEVRYATRIARADRTDDQWILRDEDGQEIARGDSLVSTAPAEQTLALLPEDAPLRDSLETVRYAPCWAVMAHFPRSLECDFGGAFVDTSPLSWIANNDSKPGRNAAGAPGESWILHGSPEWSYAHLEDAAEDVTVHLLDALAEALGRDDLPTPDLARAHRWRFALPTAAAGTPALWDADWQLAVAGDGCPTGARVEGAFLSGWTAARRIRLDRQAS